MQKIIQIDNITITYDKKVAVENANLTIYDHDYLGVIGPNGGGKTSLMKVLLGLKKPLSGNITFFRDGKEVKELQMGYLPQYNDIDKEFPISVYEVVLSGLSREKRFFHSYLPQQRQRVTDILKYMQMEKYAEQPIGKLSGGQLQRVLLARAIVSKPDIVVLDEPNTYIDKRFQEQMYEMLNEINKQCAIIIVSHDIAEILNNVKHVACVNKHVHYHNSMDMPIDKIEQHFLGI
nr:ABC transporter ATP-binding protein [Prevotella sp.]